MWNSGSDSKIPSSIFRTAMYDWYSSKMEGEISAMNTRKWFIIQSLAEVWWFGGCDKKYTGVM